MLRLADKADVDVGEVYVVDASRRSSTLNAYVNGIGSSKRVVIYDNTIRELTPAEFSSLVAHELGHVKNYDIRVFVIAFALVGVVAIIADLFWRISFFNSLDDDNPGSGVIGLVVFVVVVILAPGQIEPL